MRVISTIVPHDVSFDHIQKSTRLPCMPFNLVLCHPGILPHDVLFDHTHFHKPMMLPCMAFNIVFGRSGILHHDFFV